MEPLNYHVNREKHFLVNDGRLPRLNDPARSYNNALVSRLRNVWRTPVTMRAEVST